MSNIAIIPARIGSKRIKEKNIKIFYSKPMIYWTYKILKKSKIFSRIYVSTESEKVINVCKKIGISSNYINQKEILFITFSLLTLSLASFYENVTPFHKRIFIYLIFTLLVFNTVLTNYRNTLIHIIIGSFSLFSILFYWDIGTYINLLLFIFLFYLILIKKFISIYKIFFLRTG